ncbi:hypothetical protein Taro_005294 [Colocasia esculenta]|uniref:Uncharacterized protein n=1 Tax=Colocasia esculenta TaxID=4460 RepID=A0A843TU69_COLES|nr:hypothetical protein [Colocasia esculenta]
MSESAGSWPIWTDSVRFRPTRLEFQQSKGLPSWNQIGLGRSDTESADRLLVSFYILNMGRLKKIKYQFEQRVPAKDNQFTLLARAGRQVQEVHLTTTLDQEGIKQAVQRVLSRVE